MRQAGIETDVSRLEQLIDERTQDYWPGPETRARIQVTKFAAIIGPYAVGKNAAIEAVRQIEPDAHKVRSFTTRPQRPSETAATYDFRPHTADTLADILHSVEAHIPVQVDVHPSGHVYGSEAAEYEHAYTFLDIMAAAVGKVRRLKTLFSGYTEIGLIATPEDWWPRAEMRSAETTEAEILKRKHEAVFSLGWMLDQGPDFPWVVNHDGQLRQTGQQMADLVNGRSGPDLQNRRVGEALLRSIKTQL